MMDAKEQEFLKRLQATFRVEADEHLRALSTGLIELEHIAEPARRLEIVEDIFREAHSLKGAARSVNMKEVESICQPLESALAALKRQEISIVGGLFDLFHEAVDTLTQLVLAPVAERTSTDRARLRALSRQLVQASQGGAPDEETAAQIDQSEDPKSAAEIQPAGIRLSMPELPSEKKQPAALGVGELDGATIKQPAATSRSAVEVAPVETVRIPIAQLDPLLFQAEEMIHAKLAGGQRMAELQEIQELLLARKTELADWQNQHMPHSNELLKWTTALLQVLVDKVTIVNQVFEQDQRSLRQMVDEHLNAMKQVLMLPVTTLVEVFPKLVRDLAREQGKEVDLVIRGAEIEIDKRILQELKDPLIHLLRNCVDHGLEKPETRAHQQKPARGTIALIISAKDSRQVEMLISDDGAGIDVKHVRAAAIKAGVITDEAAEKLSPQETLALIFQSGISTSEIITNISGRGLGLAIVREKVEKLGGSVTVETFPGAGTTFRLRMPLTLATFRGVLVRACGQLFILPTIHVERTVRVHPDEIQTVEIRETIRFEGQVLALVKLGDVLGLPVSTTGSDQNNDLSLATADHIAVLILVSAEKRIAVQVDEVLTEEEVLVKGLGKQLSRVRNISGATILGAGTVVPIINVADLMVSAVRPGAAALARFEKVPTHIARIMVAEDSITARSLLKTILETGGFQVSTAVDGVDAYTQLVSGEFDLVVSDVDMPRMSGFELTSKIRGDKKLADLPIVLVTALESRRDRERGIEVGANAYIIKSSFSQNNLLKVIQRLL